MSNQQISRSRDADWFVIGYDLVVAGCSRYTQAYRPTMGVWVNLSSSLFGVPRTTRSYMALIPPRTAPEMSNLCLVRRGKPEHKQLRK
jgi:hypothetical protein